MIEGFDKEIDSLLRRTAKGESVQTFDAHLDADEISLFAENALTTKARTHAVHHLAECAKCRKILSHLISFNAENESETIHAGESNIIPVTAQAVVPWYRRLFAFPQITFAMGALVLAFSGIMAFLVLQSASDSAGNVSVAQREPIRETTKGTSGASSDGETSSVETYSNSAANVSPGIMSNSNAATTVSNTTTANTTSLSANSNANVAMPAVRQPPQAENNEATTKSENSYLLDGQERQNQPTQTKPDIPAGVPAPKDANQPRPSERSRDDAELKLGKEQDAITGLPAKRRELPKSAMKKSADADKNKSGESRSVGGKTFNNVGNIWFDSAYDQRQSPTMIRRGSDNYRRLDSGLRSIAESLGGTVIVVWKSRAYRIHD